MVSVLDTAQTVRTRRPGPDSGYRTRRPGPDTGYRTRRPGPDTGYRTRRPGPAAQQPRTPTDPLAAGTTRPLRLAPYPHPVIGNPKP